MFRLTVVTCLVLGTALAKPPPTKGLEKLPNPVPVPEGLDPVPFQEGPAPIPYLAGSETVSFDDERQPFGDPRVTYTLATGSYNFTSPNYSGNYPDHYYRSFTMRGNSGQDITITCDPFRMESHSTCFYDFLSINEQKYCGTSAPPTTTVSELRIVIKTDHSVTDSGFYCRVTVGCQCGQRENSRIVGGTDATANQFPWQAGLVWRGGTSIWCGGSVINNRYVLTAAHCTEGKNVGNIQVLLGNLNIGSTDAGEQRLWVEQKIEHPDYTSHIYGWDFALLKLDREITFSSTISPVCLPDAGESYADATAIASGYGLGAVSPILQHVQLPVWSQSSCQASWGTITDSMICAGGSNAGAESVCFGDSGGPLVTEVSGRSRLIGVVSFGYHICGKRGMPDVFARVTEALTWIASSTVGTTTCSP